MSRHSLCFHANSSERAGERLESREREAHRRDDEMIFFVGFLRGEPYAKNPLPPIDPFDLISGSFNPSNDPLLILSSVSRRGAEFAYSATNRGGGALLPLFFVV